MLNTQELRQATNLHDMATPVRRDYDTDTEWVNARRTHDVQNYALEQRWAEWLGTEYASELNEAQRDLVFQQAWDDNHGNGYESVEGRYDDIVDFVTLLNDAR